MELENVMRFEHIIREAASNYCLPWSLLMAICYVESRGDPLAFNEASKATGLFQVIPSEVGPDYKNRPTIEELKDPVVNAEWGAIILDWFRKVEGGSIKWGLFRYSGGPTWVKHADPYLLEKLAAYDDFTQYRRTAIAFEQFEEAYWDKVTDARCEILREIRNRRKSRCLDG